MVHPKFDATKPISTIPFFIDCQNNDLVMENNKSFRYESIDVLIEGVNHQIKEKLMDTKSGYDFMQSS